MCLLRRQIRNGTTESSCPTVSQSVRRACRPGMPSVKPFIVIRLRSRHLRHSLFTIHYSPFTVHCFQQGRTGLPVYTHSKYIPAHSHFRNTLFTGASYNSPYTVITSKVTHRNLCIPTNVGTICPVNLDKMK